MKNMNSIKKGDWVLFFPLMVLLALASCGPTGKSSQINEQEGKDGSEWQTGIALYSFNRFPFPETLDMSKKAGVKYVEGFFFHKLGEDFDNRGMSELTSGELGKMLERLEERELEMRSIYAG